jgi:hypothetical protein
MSVVGPIAAKKLQGRECSEVPDRTHALQENSLVISIKSSTPWLVGPIMLPGSTGTSRR